MQSTEIIFALVIFLIILFVYIHIHSHFKTSSNMEIYEYSYTTNTQLQEICDLKQPVLFNFVHCVPEMFQDVSTSFFSKFSNNEILVKDIDDYWKTPSVTTIESVPLSIDSFVQLTHRDHNKQFFTENNHSFIQQHPHIDLMTPYLQPHFTFHPTYDFITGSYNAITPLRFHKDYRFFLTVVSGSVKVKMLPHKHHKELNCVMDYENMEYWSPVNSFDPSNNIQFLDFEVFAGYSLYIPPYWFYSLKFSGENQQNIAITTKYNSPMNILANIGDYSKSILQKYNTQYKPSPTISPIAQSNTL